MGSVVKKDNIVIDSFVIFTPSEEDEGTPANPAVAFSTQSNYFLVVWEFANDEQSILVASLLEITSEKQVDILPTNGYTVITAFASQYQPSIVYDSSADEFVLAVELDLASANFSELSEEVVAAIEELNVTNVDTIILLDRLSVTDGGFLQFEGATNILPIYGTKSLTPHVAYDPEMNTIVVVYIGEFFNDSIPTTEILSAYYEKNSGDNDWDLITTSLLSATTLDGEPLFDMNPTIDTGLDTNDFIAPFLLVYQAIDEAEEVSFVIAKPVTRMGQAGSSGAVISQTDKFSKNPQIEFSEEAAEFLIVWDVEDTETSYLQYVAITDSSSGDPFVAGYTFYINSQYGANSHPAIGYSPKQEAFTVAWEKSPYPTTSRESTTKRTTTRHKAKEVEITDSTLQGISNTIIFVEKHVFPRTSYQKEIGAKRVMTPHDYSRGSYDDTIVTTQIKTDCSSDDDDGDGTAHGWVIFFVILILIITAAVLVVVGLVLLFLKKAKFKSSMPSTKVALPSKMKRKGSSFTQFHDEI